MCSSVFSRQASKRVAPEVSFFCLCLVNSFIFIRFHHSVMLHISDMLSPLRIILPMSRLVPLLVETSVASSSTVFINSSNPCDTQSEQKLLVFWDLRWFCLLFLSQYSHTTKSPHATSFGKTWKSWTTRIGEEGCLRSGGSSGAAASWADFSPFC